VVLVLLVLPGYQCAQTPPQIDYHQHLFNPEITKLGKGLNPIEADDLMALLEQRRNSSRTGVVYCLSI
jgi:hypothetical protein